MKKYALALCLVAFSFFAMTGLSSRVAFSSNNVTSLTPTGAEVRLNGSEIGSTAAYYSLKAEKEGKKVSVVFFLVRDRQNSLHVALDACDACWAEGKGYTNEGDVFICNNCNMRFNVARIGMRKGGCNPHPLPFKEENGTVVLQVEDLKAGAAYFIK